MRTRALAVAGLLLFSGTVIIGSISAQPAGPPVPQPSDNAPDTLVQTRASDQRAREQIIGNKGAAGRLTAMRSIVRSYFRAPTRNSLRITNSQQLDALDAEETAQFLTMLGYDPAALQSNGAQASAIVKSAANILFSRSSVSDAVTVSPNVVVGRLKSVTASALGDGYGSTASFEVIQSIKGSIAVGSTLQLRQRSGPRASGESVVVQGEFQPGMAGDFLVFVSPDMYRFRARGPTSSSSSYVASFLLPYQVINGTAYAIGDGQQSNGFAVSGLAQ